MKKCIFIILSLFLLPLKSLAGESLIERLNGRILLQIESNGEAWYVNPTDLKKYYLGKPKDAFEIMKHLGIGITNIDLAKIPIAITKGPDKDKDGLSDNLEIAIGTNPLEIDSDNDGYSDANELANNYDPLSKKKLNPDYNFSRINAGKIFIQTESRGEAWYVNPSNYKRYYLGKPSDAFNLMRNLGLGISNKNINKIVSNSIVLQKSPNKQINKPQDNLLKKERHQRPISYTTPTKPAYYNSPKNNQSRSADSTLTGAATAIRAKNKQSASAYFSPGLKRAIDHTIDFLNKDGILLFSNLLSDLKFKKQIGNKKIYETDVYFSLGGKNVKYKVTLEKQENEEWLIVSL